MNDIFVAMPNRIGLLSQSIKKGKSLLSLHIGEGVKYILKTLCRRLNTGKVSHTMRLRSDSQFPMVGELRSAGPQNQTLWMSSSLTYNRAKMASWWLATAPSCAWPLMGRLDIKRYALLTRPIAKERFFFFCLHLLVDTKGGDIRTSQYRVHSDLGFRLYVHP